MTGQWKGYFNPRSHKGSDQDPVLVLSGKIFQSTLPQGERQCGITLYGPPTDISIHAPTRGATLQRKTRKCIITDFNPRSHKGSDAGKECCSRPCGDFNPRSHKGSDGEHISGSMVSADFNPRSHKGSDFRPICIQYPICISIHAPTRGATHFPNFYERTGYDFNPRSHKGSDGMVKILWSCETEFQSTLPQGERRLMERNYNATLGISIHAPTRGATKKRVCLNLFLYLISIHAPTRGATQKIR